MRKYSPRSPSPTATVSLPARFSISARSAVRAARASGISSSWRVEHAAGDTDRAACRGDVRREAAAQVERQSGPSQPALQQDEAAALSDVAARFVALEDEPVDEIFERRVAGAKAARFREHPGAGAAHLADDAAPATTRPDRRSPTPARAARAAAARRGNVVYGAEAQAEGAAGMGGDPFEAREHAIEPVLELGVEDADTAGARACDRERHVAMSGRGDRMKFATGSPCSCGSPACGRSRGTRRRHTRARATTRGRADHVRRLADPLPCLHSMLGRETASRHERRQRCSVLPPRHGEQQGSDAASASMGEESLRPFTLARLYLNRLCPRF